MYVMMLRAEWTLVRLFMMASKLGSGGALKLWRPICLWL
jgi:hypothetical protein